MMQRTNEEELDLLADLLDPVGEIITDPAVRGVFESGGKPITAIKYAIKNHKRAVIEIMARIDGVPFEEYRIDAIRLPLRLLALLNKPEVKEVFITQGMNDVAARSSSATESTEDGAV